MLFCLFLAMLCASSLAAPALQNYSFSRDIGSGSGTSFSTEGEGRVTGVRVWEINNAYITGIQLRYGYIWSAMIGRVVGEPDEMILYDGEFIRQISGKYHPSNYIYQLMMVTSKGRILLVGQPTQISFNLYPTHPEAELRLLSGRYNGNGITSLAAHWAVVIMHDNSSTDNSM